MNSYLATIALIFVLMVAFILVERAYRAFTRRHPEFGPGRKELGCGACGGCGHPNEDTESQGTHCRSGVGENSAPHADHLAAVDPKIAAHNTQLQEKGKLP